MTKYLISFPSEAMAFPQEDFEAVVEAAHAVIDEAKSAGVYVFGGGIDEDMTRCSWPATVPSPKARTQATRCPMGATPFSSCLHGRRHSSGQRRPPSPAAARNRFGSSSTTRPADEGIVSQRRWWIACP